MKIRALLFICCTSFMVSAVSAQKQTGTDTPKETIHIVKMDKRVSELMADRVTIRKDMGLKELAEIDHRRHVISPEAIEPIQKLKTLYQGSKNPRLHTDEVLIALSVSAATDPTAQLALDQLPLLRGCQAHTSVMVSSVDMKQFKKLSIQATFEAKYEKNPVFFNEMGV